MLVFRPLPQPDSIPIIPIQHLSIMFVENFYVANAIYFHTVPIRNETATRKTLF